GSDTGIRAGEGLRSRLGLTPVPPGLELDGHEPSVQIAAAQVSTGDVTPKTPEILSPALRRELGRSLGETIRPNYRRRHTGVKLARLPPNMEGTTPWRA